MTTDLMMLIASAVLTVLLALPYTTGFMLSRGLYVVAGNREDFPAGTGWIGRAHRAHLNMVENIVPFAALVLAAAAAGKADAWTALGSQVFFYSRVLHAVVYIAGVPWVRTLAYLGGVAGMALVLYGIVA
ncbi:MAG: MAPEG family protein [Ferrovibrio sp.]|uniref:MAPEG family protein n=1 Tax=Ferrovibrio sp. TaxID=1917215 RepID=UPI0026094489|nr:MAPEG family protein [Ferrovibrio sp.]MCW0234347.1 MAPEG family protein [Ferrovibrio sp.]